MDVEVSVYKAPIEVDLRVRCGMDINLALGKLRLQPLGGQMERVQMQATRAVIGQLRKEFDQIAKAQSVTIVEGSISLT
jgi:hypothetical protein